MSLRVWLPLTKDLKNQGLDDIEVTNNGATFSSNGKLGGCYSFSSNAIYGELSNTNEMTSMSGCCWVYLTNLNSAQYFFHLGGISSYPSKIALDYEGGIRSQVNGVEYNSGITLAINTWYHIAVTVGGNKVKWYLNGEEKASTNISGTFNASNHLAIGARINSSAGNTFAYPITNGGRLNDVRIYDHCLSPMEVKELSKGLVLHYPLNHMGLGQENLFKSTQMTASERSGFVSNSSTDWTKYFRYYNGAAGLHSFSNDVDTISLNGSGNLGICFVRSATDISLDSTSNYIISCEAKCTKAGAHLDIGLSYYNNSNAWVWRGGTNAQNFNTTNTWQKFTLTFKPDVDTQYICYCFTVIGASGSTDTWSIRHCKLEKGSVATPWSPAPSDTSYIEMGLNSNIEFDTSGFCNNSRKNAESTYSSNTPKYDVSTFWGAVDTPRATLNDTSILPSLTNCTIAWWENCATTGNTLLFSGQTQYYYIGAGNNSNPLYDYNIGTSGITLYKDGVAVTTAYSGLRVNHTGTYHIKDEWHHYVLTGINLSAWTTFIINGYTSWPLNAYLSDVRIYATALSAEDVKSLYQNSAYIDSSGNVYGAVHSEV